MPTVDLNCDMGESFGAYSIGADADVMAYITSANIACGFHGGDPTVMRETVSLALEHNVAIGAHPGLPDLVGFGRRTMEISAQDAYDIVVYQVGALMATAAALGARVAHVKPHGALYNMAAAKQPLSQAIARAVRDVDARMILFGLAGSYLVSAGEAAGLRTASEVFADRNYMADGSLVPRSRKDAMVESAEAAVARAIHMVQHGGVQSVDGTEIQLRADTICLHGDGEHAADFARRLRDGLQAAHIEVAAIRVSERQ